MGLGGRIDVDSLSGLSLFSLSVANNDFSGPFPSDINKLLKLRGLYLMNNRFNGEIGGDAFSGMKALRKVVTHLRATFRCLWWNCRDWWIWSFGEMDLKGEYRIFCRRI